MLIHKISITNLELTYRLFFSNQKSLDLVWLLIWCLDAMDGQINVMMKKYNMQDKYELRNVRMMDEWMNGWIDEWMNG